MFTRLCFLGAALALIACGNGRVDPTTTGGTGTGGSATGGSGTGGMGTGAGTGTGTGTGTGGAGCNIDDNGGAGLWDSHPIKAAGGSLTETALTQDAGIDDLIAALDGEFNEIPIDVTITDAVVIARGYVPESTTSGVVTFWFQDANGVGNAYFVDSLSYGVAPSEIEPGDTVSLHATLGVEYYGTYEVTQIDSITVSHDDNPVPHISYLDGRALDSGAHHNQIVEVWGQLTSDGVECGGGRECFEFSYGDGHTGIFRTNGTSYKDDCVHFIGPLGEFSGDAQINIDDFDWYQWW